MNPEFKYGISKTIVTEHTELTEEEKKKEMPKQKNG